MPAGVSAYVPLANITLSASQSAVVFSSMLQSYRDLVLVANTTATAGSQSIYVIISGDFGANYNYVTMVGNGSSASSSAINNSTAITESGFTNSSNNFIINVMDYSATDKHKPLLIRGNNAAQETNAMAARWASTSAVTSIQLTASANQFAAGSTFALYGVSA